MGLSNMVTQTDPTQQNWHLVLSSFPRSFTNVVTFSTEAAQHNSLPSPTTKDDTLSIKITQQEYEKGLADC